MHLLALLLACWNVSTASVAAAATGTWAGPAAYAPRGAHEMKHVDARGIERRVYVWIPERASSDPRRYPVVVVLDADYAFDIARTVVRHFADRGRVRPMAVVGITHPGADHDIPAYRRGRTRDYTPTHTLEGVYGPEYQKHSGGGPDFQRTLADVILPELARRFPLDRRDATLVGHSFGGLFAAWTLATRPDAFDRYLIVSPSLWYDERMMFALVEPKRTGALANDARVYLAVGGRENPRMESDLRRFADALRMRRDPRLGVDLQVFEQDNHDGVFPAAFTAGLIALEKSRRPLPIQGETE
ncbi:MAG TPA: alpha/beta hydrolase-fold protein [Xanthomonadales bacterium]|nr:alpha/beta hydrolase-fold protein [Xanthomonadales bacterium]